MKQNQFKAALKRGEKQVGIWISNPDAVSTEVIAGAGYDWALCDMEHAPNSYADVGHQLRAFGGATTTPIVRPIWNDSLHVKQLMDLGAPGILFPMVQNVEEAEAAVAATRYPPKGIRGAAGIVRAAGFGRDKDYKAQVEGQTCILIQLESQSALTQAEQIADIDGVDGIFFGPADISADMGHGGNPAAPEVWEAVMPVAEKLMSKGMPVGTLTLNPEQAKDLLKAGFSFVACGMDIALMAKAADALLADVRSSL